MAYLPYKMYGNGNFHLPIIDIVQTINSATQVCKKSKLLKPIITTSSKGFHNLKKEIEWGKRTEKPLRAFSERKSISYNYFPREEFLQEDPKNFRRCVSSKTRIIQNRRNVPQTESKMLNCNCDKDKKVLGEKKSLQVLFKAAKASSLFDKDSFKEEEFNFSSFKGPFISSANLKRKGSFADYIKIKRRKRNEW